MLRGLDVGDAEGDPGRVGSERHAFGLGLPKGERQVGRLELVGADGARRQPEHAGIELPAAGSANE